jgi:hypothetical protein
MASPDTSRYYTTPRAGIASVGSYQIAGTPYISASALADGHVLQFDLPAVSRRLLIQNNSVALNTDLILAFDNPVTNPAVVALGHGLTISSPADIGASFTLSGSVPAVDLDIKCSKFFLYSPNSSGATVRYTVVAELTGIQPGQMFELSGSGINDI